MSKSLSGAHEFEVLVQRGFLIFRNIVLRFILLISSPLFFSFTILMDSLFCPGHQLKLYSINLTEEIFVLCKYNQSLLSNCQQKAICCEMLVNTSSLCLWFTGLETVYLKCHFLECSGVSEQSLWPKMLCFKMFIWHLKNKPPSIPKFFQLYHFL